jgi:hypothetical protein
LHIAEEPVANWITIIGWVVTSLLTLVVGLIIGRVTRPKRTLLWSVMNESRLLNEGLLEYVRAPIQVFVSGNAVDNVASTTLRLGNTGNQTITNATAHIEFPVGTVVQRVRLGSGIGVFEKTINITWSENRAELTFQHINADQKIDVELLVSNYAGNDVKVEMAAPDVTVLRGDSGSWSSSRLARAISATTEFSFGFLGIVSVKTNPMALVMLEMTEELRRIRMGLGNITGPAAAPSQVSGTLPPSNAPPQLPPAPGGGPSPIVGQAQVAQASAGGSGPSGQNPKI